MFACPSEDSFSKSNENITVKCESLELEDVLDMDVNCKANFSMNFNPEIKMKNEIFLKSEIHENPLLTVDYVDDGEVSCEDTKIGTGDTKVNLDIDKNWKDKKTDTFKSTNEINERMPLNSKIKNEPLDDNSFVFLPEYVDDTLNVSSNGDGNQRRCENIETDIDHTSGNFANVRSAKSTEYFDKCAVNKIPVNCENPTGTTEEKYQCDVCNKGFKKMKNLNIHKFIHTGEKPHVCEVCKKCFSQLSNLNRHKRVHTGAKPYQCAVCKKSFNQSSGLRRHKHVHTDEKPFQCDVCKKCFSTLGYLKEHNRVHTGVKPYQCEVCKKCFIVPSDLKKHSHIHTDEKPYQCDICKKCFSRSGYLQTHSRVHAAEKQYKCEVCKKYFTASKDLKRHSRVHTGEKPYQCTVCKKCFGQSRTLRVHLLTHS